MRSNHPKRNKNASLRRSASSINSYQSLEPRQLLATLTSFGAGELAISFDAVNDSAIVDVNGSGDITVNGNDQIVLEGSVGTVAATSVTSFVATGTSDTGQTLELLADLSSLSDINTSDVDMITVSGSYNLDNLVVAGSTLVTQTASSSLSVSTLTDIEAISDIDLFSASNDFSGVFTAEGDNVSIRDMNEINLGGITALGDLEIEATEIEALLTSISVAGDAHLEVVDGVSMLQTSMTANNLAIYSSDEFSGIFLSDIDTAGDASFRAGSISGEGTWDVTGNTSITSIALRDLLGDAVSLGDVTVSTNDYYVNAPFGSVILGDATVAGNTTIYGVHVTVESTNGGDSGDGTASSNAGVATISVDGDTTITALGAIDAELATLNSDNLTINTTFADVVFGTATLVTGNLNVSAGGDLIGGTVNVGGAATLISNGDIELNLAADGNSILDAKDDIHLLGLASDSVTLRSGGNVTNADNATIDIDNNLTLDASSVSLGNMANDVLNFARVSGDVTNALVLEEQSDTRLLNISAGSLAVSSTGSITNRNDATIDVPGDVTLTGSTILVGQTAADTFNAGRLQFNSSGTVNIAEDSGTELFGSSTANIATLKTSGEITDDANASLDVVFATLFEADSVTIGDTPTDNFTSRTLSFSSPGHVDVSQDSRLFLTNVNDSSQLTLSSTVSILDSPTTEVGVAGEISFNSPYINVGDAANDVFNAGSISLNASDTVNLTENSDTVFSGSSDVRLVIIRTDGSMTNAADASIEATSGLFTVTDEIALGTQSGDFFDIDRLSFNTVDDVTIEQDDSAYFYGNNTADNLQITASGPIGDSGTASFQIAGNTLFSGTTVWIGEGTNDTFNTGTLTVQATGQVIIGEDSLMLLRGVNTAFRLTLTSDSVIADDDNAEITVQNFATFTADGVHIGDTATDCFEIIAGESNLVVNATTANVTFGC